MTKQEKREQRIRQNVNQVRFTTLDALLQSEGFDRTETGGSHVQYRHPKYHGVLTVATHGAFVPSYQVKQALTAIDAVRA